MTKRRLNKALELADIVRKWWLLFGAILGFLFWLGGFIDLDKIAVIKDVRKVGLIAADVGEIKDTLLAEYGPRLDNLEAQTKLLSRAQPISLYDPIDSHVMGDCLPGTRCTAVVKVSRTALGAKCTRPKLLKMFLANGVQGNFTIVEHTYKPIRPSAKWERIEFMFMRPFSARSDNLKLYLVHEFNCPHLDPSQPIAEVSEPISIKNKKGKS